MELLFPLQSHSTDVESQRERGYVGDDLFARQEKAKSLWCVDILAPNPFSYRPDVFSLIGGDKPVNR